MTARGFTLIEVIVSFTLLSLVLAASYRGYAQGPESDARAEVRLAAIARAETVIAGLRAGAVPLRTQQTEDGPWRNEIRVAAGQVPDLWEVAVQVTRNGHGPVTLETMVMTP